MEQCIIMSIPVVALEWSSGKGVIYSSGPLPKQSNFCEKQDKLFWMNCF